jgi:hypothetical protein
VVKAPKNSVKPKGSESIVIKVKSGIESGARSSVVTLTTNDPAMPVVDLSIRWIVEKPAMFQPKSMRLGKVKPLSSISGNVRLLLKGDLQFADLRVLSTDPNVKCLLTTPQKDMTQERNLWIEVTSGSTSGAYHSGINLYQGNIDLHTTLPIQWEVESSFTASPSAIFTAKATPGEIIEREIIISTSDGQLLEVENISAVKSSVEQITIKEINEKTHHINIRLKVPDTHGIHRFLFSLKNRYDGTSRAVVPWCVIVP